MEQQDLVTEVVCLKEKVSHMEMEIRETKRKQEEHGKLLITVEKLATNMEYMMVEQREQGNRLTKLEDEPKDSYDKLKWLVVSVIVSGVVGYVLGFILK